MLRHQKIILAALLLLPAAFAQAQAFIPFKTDAEGHLYIKASISGVEGNFIFDTAAGIAVISKNFAAKISGLKKLDGAFTGFRETGEPLESDLYKATFLSIGKQKAKNPTLMIMDADFGPADGIISLMSFRNSPFTIDYASSRLIFETKKSLDAIARKEKQVSLQLDISRDKSLTVFAYMIVNDKLTLQIGIDSGAGADVFHINAKYISALGADTASARKIIHTSEFNPAVKTVKYLANVNSIRLKAQPKVLRSNFKALFVSGLIYDGIVSMDWLGRKITFDLSNSRMFVRS